VYSNATGTFDFGSGPDSNYSTCGHCFFVVADLPDHGIDFLATSGTMQIAAGSQPFGGVIDAVVNDVTFEEVTIDPDNGFESTVVPNGACFHLEAAHIVVPVN
jgi:hypothetical protein